MTQNESSRIYRRSVHIFVYVRIASSLMNKKTSTLLVRGRCHPPPVTDPKYRGWMIRMGEENKVMPKAIGKPVYIEHDYSKKPVGKIKQVYKDKKSGSLVVDIVLNDDHAGLDAMKRVQSLELGELSIGFDAWGNEETGERVSNYDPQEISLVRKGAMDDALIFAIQIDDVSAVHTKNQTSVYTTPQIHTVQNSMSEQTPASSSSAPADADFMTKYTPEQVRELVAFAETEKTRKLEELRRAMLDFVKPAWEATVKENPDAADPDFGPAVERIVGTLDGQTVMRATANIVGNYKKLEAKYLAEKESREKIEAELKSRKESEIVLKSPEERNLMLAGIGNMFSANVTNSAGDAEETPSKKPRMSFADMFNNDSIRASSERIRTEMMNGQIMRPSNRVVGQ
jgi:hypothetical protein